MCGPSYSSSPCGQWVGRFRIARVLRGHAELIDLVILAIVLIDKFTETKLAVNSQLLTVLGVVLGLVISFRTSSAYER